jgi:PAS domain S-box-containing protein
MEAGIVRREDSVILDQFPDSIIKVDANWAVLYMNTRAERLLGTALSTIAGRQLWSVSSALPPAFKQELQAAIDLPVSRTFKCQGDGPWLQVDLFSVAGGCRMLQFRDVTELHSTQAQLGETLRRLEQEIERCKQAESTIEANHEFIAAVLDNIEPAIVACDETGTLKLFNTLTREFHGLPEQPIPPEDWAAHYNLYSADGMRLLRKEEVPLYRAFCGETIHNVEMVLAPENSPRRTVLASGRALISRDGRKLGAVVALHDITHRKVANKRVRDALRHFRTLFNDAPVPYHEIDRSGVVRRVNRAECDILGRSREEMIGRPIWDFVVEDEREMSRTAVMEKLAGIRPLGPLEREYETRSGQRITFEIYENFICDPSGRIIGLRSAMLDITDRKRNEEQAHVLMRERTAREQAQAASAGIQSILERIGDAYMAFDLEWRYTYVNHRAAELALKPASELIGRCVWDEFPGSVDTQFFAELHRSLRHQISIEFENYFAPLGKWFENTVYPSPSGVAVFYRDISERKRTYEALEKKTAELASKNDELETFASIASHDLQEPLRMIAGFTDLLARKYQGRLDSEADEYIRYTIQGTHRMQRLIKELLLLSRAGECDPRRFRDISVGSALDIVLSNLSSSIRDTSAVITHQDLPTVKAVETHLVQLLQNLIGNAINYRSDKPPLIAIAAERDGKCWKFSVRDNGIGFDMKHAGAIFKPFKRLHLTHDSGTGIGLAICKKIVERRGGRIWVESIPGEGTTFYFTIPDECGAANI